MWKIFWVPIVGAVGKVCDCGEVEVDSDDALIASLSAVRRELR